MFSQILTRGFLIRFVVTGAILGVIGAIVVGGALYFGAVNLAADQSHSRLKYFVLHNIFKRTVAMRSLGIEAPDDLDDPGRISLGAQHFNQNCSKCHGGPGIGQNPLVMAMHPRPQHLPAVVDQFEDRELFWILKHGVMMSAMPAWPSSGPRDDEVWSMVAFIRRIDEMDTETYRALVETDAGEVPVMPWGEDFALSEYEFFHKDGPAPEEYLYATPATAYPDHQQLGIPVAQCAACHGPLGTGASTVGQAPNLTIQSADYIASALRSYAAGDRHSGYMQVVATGLSNPQIDALADYYANQLPTQGVALLDPVDPALVERGRQLALEGKPEEAMPACITCHNRADPTQPIPASADADMPAGGAPSWAVPNLAGQSPAYIRNQLHIFREGGRGKVVPWNPMPGVAQELTDEEIDALAAYWSTIEPEADLADEIQPLAENHEAARLIVERVCEECHTEDLDGVPSGEFPNLTLQTDAYAAHALRAYRSDERENSRMRQTAIDLSLDEIEILASYIGALEPQIGGSEAEIDPAMVEMGEQIVTQGLPDQDVPACLTCHGEGSTQMLPQIAHLHGQYVTYLDERLDYFQSDQAEDLWDINPMTRIASNMTSEQRQAAASWFASQAPLPKGALRPGRPAGMGEEANPDGPVRDEDNSPDGPGGVVPEAGENRVIENDPDDPQAEEDAGDGADAGTSPNAGDPEGDRNIGTDEVTVPEDPPGTGMDDGVLSGDQGDPGTSEGDEATDQ